MDKTAYHHGDLPNALRRAAVEVIEEKGLGSFSLREVARRAGVSHAAPAHHFGDTTGLLTSLAVEALETLRAATAAAAASADGPRARLDAVGRAYVQVALSHPGHCEVVFRVDVIDPEDEAYLAAGLAAHAVLEDTLRELLAEINPDLDVADAAKLCWSSMQGLVVLYDKMARMDEVAGRPPSSIDELVVRFTDVIVEGLRAR